MNAMTGVEAAMAVSTSANPRPGYVRKNLEERSAIKRNAAAAYVANGGRIEDYARIHRMPITDARYLAAEGAKAKAAGTRKGALGRNTRAYMGQLADRVAEGAETVTDAGRALGWAQSRTSRVWRHICRELGSQAV